MSLEMSAGAESELDAIRARPAMYIGDVHDGSGLAHMVWELLANSLDQHLARRCTRIAVTLEADGAVTVDDDGPGMPLVTKDGRPFIETVFTRFHDTPTFDGHAPHIHVSANRSGLGLFPLNAVSSRAVVDVFRGNVHYVQRFARGVPTSALEELGPCDRSGTRVSLLPDPTIFEPAWFDTRAIAERLQQLSCLLPALTLAFRDEREHVFREPTGLVAWLNRTRQWRPSIGNALVIDESRNDIRVEAAVEWLKSEDSIIESFANVEPTRDGGMHVEGLTQGIREAIHAVLPDLELPIHERLPGLHAIVCVRLLDPTYDSPTRSRLETPAVRTVVSDVVSTRFAEFLQSNDELRAHLARGLFEAP